MKKELEQLEKVKKRMIKMEDYLSSYASFSHDAIRLKPLDEEEIRPAYFRDIDRIIYSLAYTRYLDKTQVFIFPEDGNITKRMVHVQFVSKIARTIGRALNLNEDLIEAIALGHDLGHVPFGHPGETILNELSLEYKEGNFNHNVQSVRALMELEKEGEGCNLSIQVLDGILCHNGEFLQERYAPNPKTKAQFLEEYHRCYYDQEFLKHTVPMTLEGCVVRICDIIGYLGRDIEDACRLNYLKEEELPEEITSVLGSTNTQIINTVVLDVIKESLDQPYLSLSKPVYNAVKALKKFNYVHIYEKSHTEEQLSLYRFMYQSLFSLYLKQVRGNDSSSDIVSKFLNTKIEEYKTNTSDVRKVIDYLAGMTDEFFSKQYEKWILKGGLH